MARAIIVKVYDGKQDTQDETLVTYPVGIPSDVSFYTPWNDVTYAQWWDTSIPPRLVSIPTYQLVSID